MYHELDTLCSYLFCPDRTNAREVSKRKVKFRTVHQHLALHCELGKIGVSRKTWIGSTSNICFGTSFAKEAIRDWTDKNHKKYWEPIIGLKQAKGFIAGPSARRTKHVLRLNKRSTKMAGRIILRVPEGTCANYAEAAIVCLSMEWRLVMADLYEPTSWYNLLHHQHILYIYTPSTLLYHSLCTESANITELSARVSSVGKNLLSALIKNSAKKIHKQNYAKDIVLERQTRILRLSWGK
jgi:hypothetical protein